MSGPCQRLPVEPVLEQLRLDEVSLQSLGKTWARVVARAKAEGGFTWMTADRIAVEVLRLHPANIWGEQWWVVAA